MFFKHKLYNIKFYFALLRNEEEKVGDEFYKLDRSLRKQIINPHNFESLKKRDDYLSGQKFVLDIFKKYFYQVQYLKHN